MATSSKKDRRSELISSNHIDTLRSLCTFTKATTKDITDSFKELHCCLSRGASTPSSSSSRGRRRRSAAVALHGASGYRESFDRPCMCNAGEKQCWLVSELETWNRVLSRNWIELHEHSWGELALQGFYCPESNAPGIRDALLTSLLMHVLLRQHRCVTSVLMDQAIMNIEMAIFWHSLQNGAGGVRYFTFTGSGGTALTPLQWMDVGMWCQSAVCLPALHSLHVSRILFDEDAARTLGEYLVRTTTLKSISFQDVQAEDKNASVLLGYLAQNTTVTTLLLQEHFVMAEDGKALARVVRNHVALESLQINGTDEHCPSGVLRAAVQSSTLKSLSVRLFTIHSADIFDMAAALRRNPPSYASASGAPGKAATTQPRGLERLAFFGCTMSDQSVEVAYAALIGGVLLELRISMCCLGEAFAFTAACQLRTDSRLRVLNLQRNELPVSSILALVQALAVNSTLEKLVFDLYSGLPELDLFTLFKTVREMDVSSRIHIDWYSPQSSEVSQGRRLCSTSGLFVELDTCSPEDVAALLEPLTSARNVISACIRCDKPAKDIVVQRLADVLGKTKSVRNLNLMLKWPDKSIVTVLRSLQQNRSVSALEIGRTTFRKRPAKALARLVEENRTLNSVTVFLEDDDSEVLSQHRIVCRELKETVPRNRYLTNVVVNRQGVNHACDFIIKDALRRNRVLVNQAARFIKGSNDKKDALAFETLQSSRAVLKDVCTANRERDEARAKGQIDEARRRLALDYFVFTGVVKAKIVCHSHPKGKPRFDNLCKDVQIQICSYLSLTDIMDI